MSMESRKSSEMARLGDMGPQHAALTQPTNHHPSISLVFPFFDEFGKVLFTSWMNHDPDLDDLDSQLNDMIEEAGYERGLFATRVLDDDGEYRPKTMEEMEPLMEMIWNTMNWGRNDETSLYETWPSSALALLMEDEASEGAVDGGRIQLYQSIEDEIKLRVNNRAHSKKALIASWPYSGESIASPVNKAALNHDCGACNGMGYISGKDFLAGIHSCIDFVDEEGQLAREPLWDRGDGQGLQPLPKNTIRGPGGQPIDVINIDHDVTHDFIEHHAPAPFGGDWETHPRNTEEQKERHGRGWKIRSDDFICPFCEGLRVCSPCHGTGAFEMSREDQKALMAGNRELMAMRLLQHGGVIEEGGDGTFVTNIYPENALINRMDEDVLDGYIPLQAEDFPQNRRIKFGQFVTTDPSGLRWIVNDPWQDPTFASRSFYDREQEYGVERRLLEEGLWGAEGLPEDPPPRDVRDYREKLKEKEMYPTCTYPGCNEHIPEGDSYCGVNKYSYIDDELQEFPNLFAPNHSAFIEKAGFKKGDSPFDMPAHQVHGGYSGITAMLDSGFQFVGFTPHGNVPWFNTLEAQGKDPAVAVDKIILEKYAEFRRESGNIRDAHLISDEKTGGAKYRNEGQMKLRIKALWSQYKDEVQKSLKSTHDSLWRAIQTCPPIHS
jgi:hypothetical protein